MCALLLFIKIYTWYNNAQDVNRKHSSYLYLKLKIFKETRCYNNKKDIEIILEIILYKIHYNIMNI